MKFAELTNKTQSELLTMLEENKKELFNIRFQRVSGEEFSNTARIRQCRRDAARIKTKLHQMANKEENNA